ncbi:hypothetical protein Vretimale_18958 [Volvox reticuliferus]|uniref:Proline dehydrogenase n=1 Tax=Volvox reticuliferus TaxID=1737510 RepID=A0A8J4LYR0_9CHLO|nr:hypothetical protein Vretifemale_20064 [Volvox reticuliferus]GIM16326.1 hypothetical protein Vretimale_18958 [Volvox reticuliferus]
MEEDMPASPGVAAQRSPASNRASLIFTPTEQQLLERLQIRLQQLVERAVEKGVKLLFEADSRTESYLLWPALEYLAYGLMRKYNDAPLRPGAAAVVFLSYGSTATSGRDVADMPRRLRAELSLALWNGYTLGIKLVDYPGMNDVSCVDCVMVLLSAVRVCRAELMVGHNLALVAAAVAGMARLRLDLEKAPVYFEHLLKAADPQSVTPGNEGYKVYKYCPFDNVDRAKVRLVSQRALELLTQLEMLLQVRQQAMNGSQSDGGRMRS